MSPFVFFSSLKLLSLGQMDLLLFFKGKVFIFAPFIIFCFLFVIPLLLLQIGPKALGKGGFGLGYDGISRALSVEFDCYEGLDTCDDPGL